MLDLLDQILHDPGSTMSVVEIAARGIAAEARCHLSVGPDDKTPNAEAPEVVVGRALAFADRVTVLCAIEDDLAILWHRRRVDGLELAGFEDGLRDIVVRLEEWRPGPD
jgi:hypothetical protein